MPTRSQQTLKDSIAMSKSYGSIYQIGHHSDLDISLFTNVAHRLRFRRDLFEYRRFAANFSLLIGLFGLSLSIFDIQISVSNSPLFSTKKNILVSFVIRFCITVTTIILMILITVYHNIDMKIEMQRYNFNDWRLGLNRRRILKFISEILICSCQPFPVDYQNVQNTINKSSYDRIMTIVMFLRFYLLARVLILRSSLHHDISARSFGAISNTSVNTKFIFKSWMTLYSIYILVIWIIFIVIWGSWAITVCEVTYTFSDSMWLTTVTFLSIGYGDIIPTTHCGRSVAILIGALGAGCTALVVAIVSRKLELTQSEKYMHNFVQDSQLNEQLQHASANIIKNSWRLYKNRNSETSGKTIKNMVTSKRKLLYNIRQVQKIRTDRRQLSDNSVGILEVRRAQVISREHLDLMNEEISQIEQRLQLIFNHLSRK